MFSDAESKRSLTAEYRGWEIPLWFVNAYASLARWIVGRPKVITVDGRRSLESESADAEFSILRTFYGVPLEFLTVNPYHTGPIKYYLPSKYGQLAHSLETPRRDINSTELLVLRWIDPSLRQEQKASTKRILFCICFIMMLISILHNEFQFEF